MPNWCDNCITITAKNSKAVAKLVEIQAFIDRVQSKEKADLLEAGTPYRRISEEGFLNHICPHETNENNWYEKNIERWGTKWDVRVCDIECHELNADKNELIVCFQTAWSPPIEAFAGFQEEMNNQEIDFSIHMIFEEEGADFIGYWLDGDTETVSTSTLYNLLGINDSYALDFAKMCNTDIETLGEAYFCLKLIDGDDSCACALCRMKENAE